MTQRKITRTLLFVSTVLGAAAPVQADPVQEAQIRATEVAPGIHMLEGQGGNIGLLSGDQGALLIDDQYAPLTGAILKAVSEITDQPVQFVLNTHWHGDHTGGNENLGRRGAVIVAHENVRKRLSSEQFMEAFNRTAPAAPEVARPVITFTRDLTFHWNGEEVRVFHVGHAHTDGDALIHFKRANVFHLGDTFFNGFYPFIDAGSGGVIDGMIEAADLVLEQADESTKIIPGHGPLGNRAALQDYRDMLVTVRARIDGLLEEGLSRDEIIARKPTEDLDAKWGGGFMKPDVWVGLLVDGIERNRK